MTNEKPRHSLPPTMLDPGDADIELIPRVSPPPIPNTGSKRVRARSPSAPIREVKKKNAARVVVTDRRAIVRWCRTRCGAAALLRTITLVIRD